MNKELKPCPFCGIVPHIDKIPLNEYGKTVFLTREAAEKALEERT